MKVKIKRKIDSKTNLSPEKIIDFLLRDRQIKDKDEFLNPKHPKDIPFGEFFSKTQFEKVIKKIKEIREKQEMIVVYTDYDADGITGGAILWETLYLLGFRVMPYVPHRQLEGYGFSKKGLETVKRLYNPSLIISVDHGISASEKIAYASSLGIPVVVTDHHMRGKKEPKAFAIFHTEELSGAGIAYFFAKELFDKLKVKNLPASKTGWKSKVLEENFSNDYLVLASIGAIADLVPLVGHSRSIAKYGLESFSKVKRYGIKHILKEAGIENRKITPYEIGFMIAPRINALGRLEHALDALRLLCTTNEERAQMLAAKLGEKNRQRQDILEKAVEEAKEKLKAQSSNFKVLPKIIILSSEKWHEGVIGLIASRLADEFYRPTIIISLGKGFAKGSARSVPGFDITSFLRLLKQDLIDVGGHRGAAGFTLKTSQLDHFCQRIQKLSSSLIDERELEKKIEIDLEIPLSKINLSLAKLLEKLEPFGIGNHQPLFYSYGELIEARLFGKNNQHLKIYLRENSSILEIIFFDQGEDFYKFFRGKKISVCYNLEINRWREKEEIRGRGKFYEFE